MLDSLVICICFCETHLFEPITFQFIDLKLIQTLAKPLVNPRTKELNFM